MHTVLRENLSVSNVVAETTECSQWNCVQANSSYTNSYHRCAQDCKLFTQGLCSCRESLQHINVLGLRVIHLALKAFFLQVQKAVIQVATANVSAMCCLKQQEGAQLCSEAIKLQD